MSQDGVNLIDPGARWFADKGRTARRGTVVGGAAGLRVVEIEFADGGRQRYLDTDPELAWSPLLHRLAGGPATGPGGRLELELPGGAGVLPPPTAGQRVPSEDQSNTLVTLDERVIVKAYRRLEAGPHPELDLLARLATTDAPVPGFVGAVRWHADDGAQTAVALVQEMVTGAPDGWETPIEDALRDFASGRHDSAQRWHEAGAVLSALHRALAEVQPLAPGPDGLAAGWAAEGLDALEEVADDPAIGSLAPEARRRLAALAERRGLQVTRIHGDMHIAQLLWAPGGARVIDFEGDPIRPLAERLRPDSPLRDLATLRRSAVHVWVAAARRFPADVPVAWATAMTAAVDAGYAAGAPLAPDPDLLRELELVKACTELLYARRVAPEWTYAARAGLQHSVGDA